jgi:hypothetical protein
MFSAGRHKGIPMVITENLPTPTPRHPFRILLIGGAKGSGKTTIARALCRRHPLHFKIVALGDALARACAAASRLPVRVFTDPRSKDRFHSALGTTPRQFMIVIGQGARSRNPQVWAERVAAEIRRRMESDTLIGVARLLGRVPTFIVPDLRDPRDAVYLSGLREATTHSVLLERPGHESDGTETESLAQNKDMFRATVLNIYTPAVVSADVEQSMRKVGMLP